MGLAVGLVISAQPVRRLEAQEVSKAAATALVIDGAIFLGSTIRDVVTAPSSAGKTNREALSLWAAVNPVNRSLGIGISVPLGSAPLPRAERRDPTIALAYSLVGALVPAAAATAARDVEGDMRVLVALPIGAAAIVGPSAGHWYAGQGGRARQGVLIRTITFAVGIGLAGVVLLH
jgi:hypothetical protein